MISHRWCFTHTNIYSHDGNIRVICDICFHKEYCMNRVQLYDWYHNLSNNVCLMQITFILAAPIWRFVPQIGCFIGICFHHICNIIFLNLYTDSAHDKNRCLFNPSLSKANDVSQILDILFNSLTSYVWYSTWPSFIVLLHMK